MTEQATSTQFSRLIASVERQADQFSIDLPADWLQGRTAYGGLSASLCLEATRRSFGDLPPLRSAQFSFFGPAAGTLAISATVLRKGKSVVFTSADLAGESGPAARATFCFGAERTLSFSYCDVPPPTQQSWGELPSYYTWPVRPNFMNHFEGRLVSGARPRTPGADPGMVVWLRHRDETIDGGFVPLLAMADALPPASTVLFLEPAPISTMTWSIDMLDDSPSTADGWWLVKCAAATARQGYSVQDTTIWSSDGRPILAARQTVAIFEKG